MKYANGGSNVDDARKSMRKYAQRQDDIETIEDMFKEGFENVYDNIDNERNIPTFFDEQIGNIIREAIDPKMKTRDYQLEKNDVFSKVFVV